MKYSVAKERRESRASIIRFPPIYLSTLKGALHHNVRSWGQSGYQNRGNLRALPAIVERPVVGWAAVGIYDTFDIQQMLKSVDHRRLEIQPILDKETYKYVHVD